MSALTLTTELFPKVVVVLDATVASSSDVYAVRAKTNGATVFLTGQDIHSYLQSLDPESKSLHVVNFASLASEAGASGSKPVAKANAPAKKTEAKIEDAHQLAIGVRKEVDFPTWYTNVSMLSGHLDLNRLDFIRFWSNLTCWITTTSAVAIFLSRGRIQSGKLSKVEGGLPLLMSLD